jgi:ATP-dependent RNA helicase DDX55/SPB4
MLVLFTLLDFMAIRKIPLKEQPYLTETDFLDTLSSSSSGKVEDPCVTSFHQGIRRTLLIDRALHDKVLFL